MMDQARRRLSQDDGAPQGIHRQATSSQLGVHPRTSVDLGAGIAAALVGLAAGGRWGYEQWRYSESLKDATLKVLKRSTQQGSVCNQRSVDT